MIYRKWDAGRDIKSKEDVEFVCAACGASVCTKCQVCEAALLFNEM